MTFSFVKTCRYIRQNPQKPTDARFAGFAREVQPAARWQCTTAIPCHLANPAVLAIVRFCTLYSIVTAGFYGKMVCGLPDLPDCQLRVQDSCGPLPDGCGSKTHRNPQGRHSDILNYH
jgi:hypothetical protein